MHLDDKWKKGVETFLTYWTTKVLQLEQIEDKVIDNSMKCQWLTNTLSTHSDMSNCINQAKVTESTMLNMGSATTKEMPYDKFYNVILAHAKLTDHSKATTNAH